MLRTFLFAAAAALSLSGCANTTQTADGAAPAERDCFRTMDVRGYGVIDDHRIRARVSASREYILTINQNVRDLDWTHAIAIESGTSFICVGNGLGVRVRGGDPPVSYPVVRIERAPQENAVEGS